MPPRPLPGDSALELEELLRTSLNQASARAAELHTGIVAIGILPTVMPGHVEGDWISENNRYAAPNHTARDARGGDGRPERAGPTGAPQRPADRPADDRGLAGVRCRDGAGHE